eukprot:135016-Lingulodinium_polyedra.AAC.1
MRSDTHSTTAAPRVSQFARCTRRPPYGGRRMERVRCEMRGSAARECMSQRTSEHRARKTAQTCA